jgi:hypothetical protein
MDIKIIFEYSAKKNNAKDMAEYSTLNPETNSDSPSVKSKGALFVSANAETKHIINTGIIGIINQIVDCVSIILVILNDPTQLIIVNIITPKDTSYDIICAAALIAPKNAYFELLDQPDIKIAYTLIEDTANIYIIPKFISAGALP